ncbi:hypothetical protein REPUB_Repub16aG0105900 [Reevesia pubescens]
MKADCNVADEFSIGDLEKLDLLGGNLCVELKGNVIDWDEAKRAKLHNKIHLKRMDITICSPHVKEDEVLQALNPPSNLHVELFHYKEEMMNSRIQVARWLKQVNLLRINAALLGEETSFFSYNVVIYHSI